MPKATSAAEVRVWADASIPPSLARSHAGLCSAPSLTPFTPSSWLLLLFVHKSVPTLCRQWLYHEVVERHFFFGKDLSSCAGTRTRGVCEAEGAGAMTWSSRALDLGHLELQDPPLPVQFIPLFNHLRLKKNHPVSNSNLSAPSFQRLLLATLFFT